MQKRTRIFLTTLVTLSLTFLVGCGDDASAGPNHEHTYEETVKVAVTCETDGVKTLKCKCGDTKEEAIKTIGHSFKEYVYNNDATYLADGTETATCSACKTTDTRAKTGSKLELPAEPNMHGLTFEDSTPKVPHYSMVDTDVYYEPSFQGPVIGHLSINEEVKITGNSTNYDPAIYNYPPYDKTSQPADIYWKRINYNGLTGYIPYMYTWHTLRDTSVTLNPLAANYPDVKGNGSGLFYPPQDGKWYYVYGASSGLTKKLVSKNPECEVLEIYDGINRNVITKITDPNTKFKLTGNAYCTYLNDRVGSYYIYEIEYNGGLAYINSLTATFE